MAVIGLITENKEVLKDVFKGIIFKSKEKNFVKNPFSIKAKLEEKDDLFFLMEITPLYPPVFWLGFVLLIPFIIFEWFNFFLIMPLLLLGIGFFWSKTFYLLVLKASIRKKGYKGQLRFLSKKDIIRRLARWGR